MDWRHLPNQRPDEGARVEFRNSRMAGYDDRLGTYRGGVFIADALTADGETDQHRDQVIVWRPIEWYVVLLEAGRWHAIEARNAIDRPPREDCGRACRGSLCEPGRNRVATDFD
jgi:hypothetical protein